MQQKKKLKCKRKLLAGIVISMAENVQAMRSLGIFFLINICVGSLIL